MMIEQAKALAKKYHKNQKDRGDIDYFSGHLSFVGETAFARYGAEAGVVGYLHDILEDTTCPIEELVIFGAEVVEAVKVLTKTGKTSSEYLDGLKKNKLAIKVKLCDLDHNMDLTRIPIVTETDIGRVVKYIKLKTKLEAFLTSI
jgi:(p)ppGpp synthase/HD superfamily hydrolase